MDFMKWLNSLDELLYEVMSWLLFFPLTLWRAIFRPFEIMGEVERQPFYAQCYPAAIFALGMSVGNSFGLDSHPWVSVTGHFLVAASILNFWVIESRWFARVLAIS